VAYRALCPELLSLSLSLSRKRYCIHCICTQVADFLEFGVVSREDTAWRVGRMLAYMRVALRMSRSHIEQELERPGDTGY
jgi:hypothetical protein